LGDEKGAGDLGRSYRLNAELEQELAVQSDPADKKAAIVRQEHCVVWRHVDAKGSRILPLAPTAENSPVDRR
jgi:hypothetical protein